VDADREWIYCTLFNLVATPLFLLVITDAPSLPNPTNFFSSTWREAGISFTIWVFGKVKFTIACILNDRICFSLDGK